MSLYEKLYNVKVTLELILDDPSFRGRERAAWLNIYDYVFNDKTTHMIEIKEARNVLSSSDPLRLRSTARKLLMRPHLFDFDQIKD